MGLLDKLDLLPMFDSGDQRDRNQVSVLRMERELWMEERLRLLPQPEDQ